MTTTSFHSTWEQCQGSKEGADKPPKPLLDALSNLLAETTPSPSSAASQLTSIVSQSTKTEENIYYLWTLIFSAAALLPDSHDSLVKLIQEIRKQPDLSCNDDKDSSEALQWSKLPNFSSHWRDQHDILHSQRTKTTTTTDNNNNSIPTPDIQYINFTAFSSRLLSSSPSPPIEIIWPYFHLRDTLEHPIPKASNDTKSNLGDLNTDVRAAAAWISHAGPQIHKARNEDIPEFWQRALGVKSPLWDPEQKQGKKGFSEARWAFWKERFGAVASFEGVAEDARIAARDAVLVMREAEGGVSGRGKETQY